MEISAGATTPEVCTLLVMDLYLLLYFIIFHLRMVPPMPCSCCLITGSPSFFKLGLNKAEQFLIWTGSRRLSTQQREDFWCGASEAEGSHGLMPHSPSQSFPLKQMGFGHYILYLLRYIYIFPSWIDIPPFFFSQPGVTGSQKTPPAVRSEVLRAALRALGSAIDCAGVKMGTIYTLMCGPGQQHQFCWNIWGPRGRLFSWEYFILFNQWLSGERFSLGLDIEECHREGFKVEESDTFNSSCWIKFLLCIWKTLPVGFSFPFPQFSRPAVAQNLCLKVCSKLLFHVAGGC